MTTTSGKLRTAVSWTLHSRLPWYALLVFLLGFFYWKTLHHGVGFWGDSAILQFIGKVLGTPFGTGFPLYVMLNYLFVTLVSKGSLATRVNLLSACFSVAAIIILFEILILLKIRRYAAFITALSFGLTYSMWFYSIIAEVYSLHILFVATVIFFLLRWHQSRRDFDFYAACAFYALSFGNHPLMILLLPSFAYLVWVTERSVFWNPKKIIIVLGLVLLGLSQYLYVVWRTNDPGTPFLVADTPSLLSFMGNPGWAFISEMSFAQVVIQNTPIILSLYWNNFYLLLPLAIYGMFCVKDRQLNIFLLSILIIHTLYLIQFEFREIDSYLLPGFLIVAIYVGFAINRVLELILRSPRTAWVALVIPVLLVGLNFRKVDQSQHTRHAMRVEEILSTVKHDAVILADDYDYAAYFWYYLIGEGYEKDRLYALSLNGGPSGDQIKAYLSGEDTIIIGPQRLNVPRGLRVFAHWRVVDELKAAGLQVNETESRYVYEVTLPDQ